MLLALPLSVFGQPPGPPPLSQPTLQPHYPLLRLIAPAAPGGGWDQTARTMQQALQAAGLVQTSAVENIPGAAGTIGLARFVSAERGSGDVVMVSGLIMLAAVIANRSDVTLRDVTPIARLTGEYEVIVVPARSPYQSLADLLDAFKRNPEAISWGGGSAGGTDQILAGLVADAVGVNPRRVNYIAFSGGGESMSAILGGQVTAGVNGLAEFAPHIEAGTVRALAISSANRLPSVNVPTLREQGVDVELENWRSLVAPPGVSAADRARLEATVERMVHSSAWRDALTRFRWNDRYLAGADLARFVQSEEVRVGAILRKLGTGEESVTSRLSIWAFPVFVLSAFVVTAVTFGIGVWRGQRTERERPGAGWKGLRWAGAGMLVALLSLERLGFVVAAAVLFWLTARAFDTRHPWRDAVLGAAISVGAYLLFARVLQLQLPAGPIPLGLR